MIEEDQGFVIHHSTWNMTTIEIYYRDIEKRVAISHIPKQEHDTAQNHIELYN